MCGLHLKIDRSIDNPSPAATGLVARGMRRTSPRFPFMFWLPFKKKKQVGLFLLGIFRLPSHPVSDTFPVPHVFQRKTISFIQKSFAAFVIYFLASFFSFTPIDCGLLRQRGSGHCGRAGGGGGGFHGLRGWAFVWRTLSLSLSLSLHLSPEKMKSLRQSQRRAGERRGFLETRSFARYFPFFLLFKQQTTDGGRIDRSEKKNSTASFSGDA